MGRLTSSADHCPFLNRHDGRCGEHMSLQGLDHAFDYCFGRYQACAVYHELLVHRKLRRGDFSAQSHAATIQANVSVTINRRAIDNVANSGAGSAGHANAA